MSNAPRCPTCNRAVSLNTDRCPMCGEDLETYRENLVYLFLLVGAVLAAVTLFLSPAMFINWLFGRFDRYIHDTFFDGPSYLMALVCWGAAVGALYYLGKEKPEE